MADAALGGGPSLLVTIQGLLERTYALPPQGVAVDRFVIGDAGLSAVYGTSAGLPGRARLLLRPIGADTHVRLYYPDRLIANLERHPPLHGLHDANLDDFSTFVEELDHLLLVALWSRVGRDGRALELEVHANVSKVLVGSLFVARGLGQGGLSETQRVEVRERLLGTHDDDRLPAGERDRYRDAHRLASRFLARLSAAPPARRPLLLRELTHAPFERQIALCA